MTLQLVNIASAAKIAVQNLPAVVGRDETSDVRLDDPLIAPYQCMIARNGSNGLTLWNLREETPVRINGREILKALLLPGDRLVVGTTEFIVEFRLPGQFEIGSRQQNRV